MMAAPTGIRMQDLTVDRIIAVHAGITARTGGDARIISEAGLHQLVFSANIREDPRMRSAFVIYSLVAYPVFREANVEVAHALALEILDHGGYAIGPADRDGLAGLARSIAAFETELTDIEAWFSAHAVLQP